MTNGWTDIRNADVVLAMGGNPAENHPVGFRFVMDARRNRNAKLVSVDPRFNRTAAVADRFVQIRAGTDIAFLGAIVNYILANGRAFKEYLVHYTNAPMIVREGYQVMLISTGGTVIRMPVEGIRRAGRSTQGVIVMRLRGDDEQVSALAPVVGHFFLAPAGQRAAHGVLEHGARRRRSGGGGELDLAAVERTLAHAGWEERH